jgi:hypothetical protein
VYGLFLANSLVCWLGWLLWASLEMTAVEMGMLAES